MIDISLWRAVIGCWMHLPIHFRSSQKRYSSLTPATSTLLAVILILLVIGCIERNPGPVLRSTTANKKGAPTYGEIITLLDQAKLEAVQNHTYVGDILVLKFQQKFPGVSIPTRSYRFLQAAERIAAPSGRYWHPPKHVADVLRKIKPSNDICESILGLNDWLQTTMPSVSQLTKRNLIEVKKNKTMQWFSTVPEQKQKEYVKMAIERKSIVKKSDKEYANAIAVERQSALQKALEKHEMKNERYERMKGELSNVMVLVNWTQLETLVRRITGNMQLKKSKKDKMTLELLKTQLKLRQILIGEPIKFYFTKGGKKIVLTQLLSSFQSMMDRYPLSNPQAMSAAEKFDYVITGGMVGEIIEHKFLSKEANEEKWYKGQVIAYDEGTQEYEIEYDGEEESCKFDLAIDCAMGYIKMHD